MSIELPPITLPKVLQGKPWRSLDWQDVIRGFDITELQTRAGKSKAAVKRYRDAAENKEKLPPVLLVQISDEEMVVVDGHHRIEAAPSFIKAIIVEATVEEATIAALTVNTTHGEPLRPIDIKQRLTIAHTLPEFEQMSLREVAETLGNMSHMTVRRWREKNRPDLLRKDDQEAFINQIGSNDFDNDEEDPSSLRHPDRWKTTVEPISPIIRPRAPKELDKPFIASLLKILPAFTDKDNTTQFVIDRLNKQTTSNQMEAEEIDETIEQIYMLGVWLKHNRANQYIINHVPGFPEPELEDF